VPNTARVRSIDLENPFIDLAGMCELVLVRHGEQHLTRDTAVGQSIDPPLSELGERQAEAVGQRMIGARIDAMYTSPLQRAADTGRAIGKHHGIEPVPVDDLQEFHTWLNLDHGRSVAETLPGNQVSEIFRTHARTKRFSAFPYAEDRDAFRARINGALGAIIDRHVGERVVVTCHSGVINAFLATIVETDQDVPIRVHHTSINVFRGADTRRAVISLNDYAHCLPLQDSINVYNQ
jgi:probable phosphoglycerate mutase